MLQALEPGEAEQPERRCVTHRASDQPARGFIDVITDPTPWANSFSPVAAAYSASESTRAHCHGLAHGDALGVVERLALGVVGDPVSHHLRAQAVVLPGRQTRTQWESHGNVVRPRPSVIPSRLEQHVSGHDDRPGHPTDGDPPA